MSVPSRTRRFRRLAGTGADVALDEKQWGSGSWLGLGPTAGRWMSGDKAHLIDLPVKVQTLAHAAGATRLANAAERAG
jgi:hypothetical protein